MPSLPAGPALLLPLVFQLILLFHLQTDSASTHIITYCSNDNFTPSNPYASNLQLLLSNLTATAPTSSTHSSTFSVGTEIFGLSQCRPDVSTAICADCLSDAAATATGNSSDGCGNHKSAALRFDYCLLRYSDSRFFGIPDETVFTYFWNLNNASNPAVFDSQMHSLLRELWTTASLASSRFAVGVRTSEDLDNIYGMAWCSPDLFSSDCAECLYEASSLLNSWRIGGAVACTSCLVRFEVFLFFSLDFLSPIPPQAVTPAEAEEPTAKTLALDNGGTSRGSQTKKIIIAVSISASILSAIIVVCILLICRRRFAKRKTSKLDVEEDIKTTESHLLPFEKLKAATNDFSNENKLGEGRFGPVYKGVLWDGRQIVVKRLPNTYGQGLVELRNEAALVAQLQHKNLVKLLGCCMQEDEKLVVYEYLPNASLDKHLYDPVERAQLDWKRRYIIIEGIARGLVYLHNHSRIRIIHRDLNANNILLDGDMNPKISDFGLAKLVGINESQWNTKWIAGTFGYMAPEYVMRGVFSTKSDVFSYGMVVLEIITGVRNGSFIELGNALNLQTYVWQHWNQGKAEEVIDQGLGGQYQVEDVLRCINIGLLCIQAEPMQRPSMASVVLMLSTNTETLLVPSLPGYFTGENPTSVSSESSTPCGGTNYDYHSTEHFTGPSDIQDNHP